MQALRRVSISAAGVAERIRHLHVVPEDTRATGDVTVLGALDGAPDGVAPEVAADDRVVSLAAARARRAGHPAGSSRPR